jgi:tetratricopeptide (TPR) repeat protein
VFEMGEDSMDALELEGDEESEDSQDMLRGLELEDEDHKDVESYTLEDIEDDDSEDDDEPLGEDAFEAEDASDGPSHAVEWSSAPPGSDVAGGAFESDEDASDVFAMGEDDEDDEDLDADIDADIEDLDDEDEDEDDTELLALQGDPGLPDEDLRLPVLETLHESLRKANPLVLLGLTEAQIRGIVSYATLREHLNRARGRWHQQRFLKADPEVRAAIQRIASLVERRWNALEQPDVLAQALSEWREQLPREQPRDRDGARRCLARAHKLAEARAWPAALVEAQQAVALDPSSIRARVVLVQSMVVLRELDIAGGLANLDALLVDRPGVKAEIEYAAGQMLRWERHHEQAIERFRRALDMNPRHSSARREVDNYERRPSRSPSPAPESTQDESSASGFLSSIFGSRD